MLIKREPDVYEKLQHLAGMATDDVLDDAPLSKASAAALGPPSSAFQGSEGTGPYRGGVTPFAGVYRASMPNGKKISLFRVMLTDHCTFDCHYCPNSYWVPRERYGFKVDELAKLFDEVHRRHMVDGLFLSSGIFNGPDATMERMVQVVEAIRTRYRFQGYVHLKVMPGASSEYVEAAHRLGTRLSVNMESPSAEHLARVSGMKRFEEDILQPMETIHDLTQARYGSAVGQATQLVVGAADETDWDIYLRQQQLYGEWGLKRIYYAPFHPVQFTPLEEHAPTAMARTHRLNQVDWLMRVYGYSEGELELAYGDDGFLDEGMDPKLTIVSKQVDRFPVDINAAPHDELVRVPGIGPIAVSRIVRQRQEHSITTWRDLQAMGVVVRRATPFVRFPGHRPVHATQGRLPMFQELSANPPSARKVVAELHQTHASAGCASCPLNPGTCGHPEAPVRTAVTAA